MSYTNPFTGKPVTVIAEFYPPETLEWHPDAEPDCDADWCAPEGWYIVHHSKDDDGPLYRTDADPTHWMPIPVLEGGGA